MDSSALTSILRSVPSVPTLAMRRAVLEAKLFAVPPGEAAALVQALAERAIEGESRARSSTVALASTIAHRRLSGDVAPLDRIASAAREAGCGLAVCICDGVPAPKTLLPRGRLPEVGLNKEAFFPSVPKVFWMQDDGVRRDAYPLRHVEMERLGPKLGRGFLGDDIKPLERMRAHPDAGFLARLLRTRWIRPRDVIVAASRRPSTPEIAIAIACDDRWLLDPRVREALRENPFTPAWLAMLLGMHIATDVAADVAASAEDSQPVAHDAS